jgi:c-di-GMP-binding flagellar brake protein YcgR
VTDQGGRAFRPREKRVPVALSCEMTGGRGRAVAQVRNLSAGGCCLHSPQRYEAQELIVVAVRTPSSELVEFAAEVRWIADGPASDVHGLGCRFIHSPRSRRQLEAILSEVALDPRPKAVHRDS